MQPSHNIRAHFHPIRAIACGLIILGLGPAACHSTPTSSYDQVLDLYNRGDYHGALTRGLIVRDQNGGETSQRAQYLAGLSAYRLGDYDTAIELLRPLHTNGDRRIAAGADATLGLVYADRDDDHRALIHLREASSAMTGDDQARAFYHQACVEQKLGYWSSAVTHLRVALNQTHDPQQRQLIRQRMDARAFTIQLGAFADRTAAEQRAVALRRRTESVGLDAPRVVPSHTLEGRRLNLLQTGRFLTHAEARSALGRLGSIDAFIVATE